VQYIEHFINKQLVHGKKFNTLLVSNLLALTEAELLMQGPCVFFFDKRATRGSSFFGLRKNKGINKCRAGAQ
jgi:hypothetical protein